ncbi:MAG: c-type cytochrome [Betaproteobacteria bacterium]
MRGFILGVIFTLVGIAGGIWAVSHFGLYPIGADNPPGALERALASRAMDEYADRHKPAGANPAAITAANLTEGATEYEEHCAFCHGGAKAKISPMRDKFNPPAPQLIDRIPHDPDTWLFWVTKHGVRMTGMPTWDGILSDDEIWKVIAFIKHSDRLPPEVQAAWQKVAATPGKTEELTPEQQKGLQPRE